MTKAETLRVFLSQLPPEAARKLLEAVDSGALPTDHLGLSIEALREALQPALSTEPDKRDKDGKAQRLFTAPLEDFLYNGDRKEKEAGRIPRSSIGPIWSWIKDDLLSDTFPDMLARVATHVESGDEDALNAAVTVMQEAAGAAMAAALERSETDVRYFDNLVRQLGDFKTLEDAREVADIFQILDEMKEMQELVPRHNSAFDEHMVSEVRDLYEELYEEDPDRAIFLALAVMGRLEFPWQILRLARKVALKKDDTMISRTDFSILGERLIRRLEVIASFFQDLRPGLSDLGVLRELITEFAQLSRGITKEIELLRIGNWGQRLLKARNIISTAIGEEFARYPKDLATALPLQRVGGFGRSGPRRVDVSHLPDEQRSARITRELSFLRDLQGFAQAIGAQNAYDKTVPELEAYMMSYENAIVEELRVCGPDESENAEAYLSLAAELTDLLSGDAAAAMLRKRGRVALQASA